jgi:hypothetical protein
VVPEAGHERWVRDFGGHRLESVQWAAGGLLLESLGPVRLASISTVPSSVNESDLWGQEKRIARRLSPNQGIGVGSSASCDATR